MMGALVLGQYLSRYACKPTGRFSFGVLECEQRAVVLLLEYRKSHNMFAGKIVNQEVVAGKKVEVKFSQEYSDGLHYRMTFI